MSHVTFELFNIHLQIVETVSDSASELWKKNRRLPLAPAEESINISKMLAAEKLSKYNFAGESKSILRPSSSLDSATAHLTAARSASCLPGRSSPHSALSDIANIMNSSTGITPAPPLTTILKAGKATAGSLLDQLSRSPNRGPVLEVPGSRENSPSFLRTSPYYGYKSLKDQLKQELKSAVGERRSVLDGRNMQRRSENDLRALFDLYSDVPDTSFAGQMVRGHRRNASDSALLQFSPTPDYLPPGCYKSHGYEQLASYLDADLATRPLMSDYRSSALIDSLSPGLLNEYDGELQALLVACF